MKQLADNDEGYILVPDTPAPTAEEVVAELEAQKKITCDLIDEAIEHYITHRLNGVGKLMIDRMLQYVEKDAEGFAVLDARGLTIPTPNQKAIEVNDWAEAAAVEAELRKALVYAGMWPDGQDPLDFSDQGEKPWTAAQVHAEYLGFTP